MNAIMIKEKLSQHWALQEEIKQLQEKIKQLETAAEGGTHRFGRDPKIFECTDRVGAYGTQLADLRDKDEERIEKSVAELQELTDFINSIEDAMIRVVFTWRYVFRMSWQQVANRLGGNTADSVRMMHNRYLVQLEKLGKLAG